MVKVSKDILVKSINQEKVLLNTKTGMYFGLDPVGGYIFDKLIDGLESRQIANLLSSEYEVTKETAIEDIEELLSDLLKNEIIS